MRRLTRHGLAATAFWLMAVSQASAGCADPCGDLQPICDRCLHPGQKASCEDTVDRDEADVCDQTVDHFTNVCN